LSCFTNSLTAGVSLVVRIVTLLQANACDDNMHAPHTNIVNCARNRELIDFKMDCTNTTLKNPA